MRRPNFFIVGAPKSGTTALYAYLRQHPDVCMPERKEPNFFCADLEISCAVRDEAAYLALFAAAGAERRVGEASVWNLYSRRAARAIQAFEPHASIIIMLRNPVDMLYALHSQRFFSGYEDRADFGAAIGLDRAPARVMKADRLMQGPFGLEVGKYADQVARYLDTFGQERVLVIVYDDFRADSRGKVQETLRFLEVDPTAPLSLDVVNANRRIRSPLLHRIVRTPPRPLRLAARAVAPRPLRQMLAGQVTRLNTHQAPRPPLPPEVRLRLQAEFAPDVARLSRLLGRDLSPWVRP